MKNIITSICLIILFCVFSVFILINRNTNIVLSINSPSSILIDLNKNNISNTNEETICIDGIETFSTNPNKEFVNTYSQKLKITEADIISLGYLAEDFAQKTLLGKNIKLKYSNKPTKAQCKFADIYIDNIDYKELLLENGFALSNGEIKNSAKFKENLKNARKLNLVILNHRSNKYHTLTCPYGKMAHDKILIPKAHLPKSAKPCKYCHNKDHKNLNKYKKHTYKQSQYEKESIKYPQPPLNISDGPISIYLTDFTKTLKPNKLCTTDVCKAFIELTNNAKESIDIALYGYDDIAPITTALKHAQERGVKIRFVYDENYNPDKTYYKDNYIITNLAISSKSDKTTSKSLSNMLMHNKFIIFDNSIVYTGSMNFSQTGLSGYDINDIVIIKSKDIANLYTQEFEQMLSGKFHTAKNKISTLHKFDINNSQIEVYFSPKDKSSIRIIEVINNAKNYIYIPTFLITHSDITNALINAHNKGVDVRIIIDANSTNTRNTKHQLLRNSGILLKTENYAGKLHSKTMIIDDEYLITGSMNFSNSGENKNDENLLIIKNSKIAKHHKKFFLYIWSLIPNKYLKINAKAESKESIGSCFDGIDNNFNGKIDKTEALCK